MVYDCGTPWTFLLPFFFQNEGKTTLTELPPLKVYRFRISFRIRYAGRVANSLDPDQEQSGLCLYCLLRHVSLIIQGKNGTRASRWRAIAYPRASAIAYLPTHQNSKCVPLVLIHRAIKK